ncbi:hypothetical protein RHGRI_024007 [Rhododendron griersonianum]|uniref:Uncharacterized protein n=2 Tax=Rhododendron TaxID=4346 RepID=A0AAV6J7Y9_9ERIC|nr:hypothetical protein RHGRI_024007 [Rhododendron griersonianum]
MKMGITLFSSSGLESIGFPETYDYKPANDRCLMVRAVLKMIIPRPHSEVQDGNMLVSKTSLVSDLGSGAYLAALQVMDGSQDL